MEMVGNPKWPFSDGEGNETNYRHVLIFLLLVILLMVLSFGFALTSRLGVLVPAQWQ
ncbi:hypothetical protein [Methylacidimicrobium cyclopophantes]|nr:hypothetical protein [Methylacidimicrobium cyclopophantes]